MYVCICKGITDSQIEDAVKHGAESLPAIRKTLGAMSECGQCRGATEAILKRTLTEQNNQTHTASFYQIA